MTDAVPGAVSGDLAGRLAVAADVDTVLALEDSASVGGRFADLEAAAATVLGCAFAGRPPIYARAKNTPVFTSTVPTSAIAALENTFDVAAQQQRGAWWLPEQLSVKYGLVNVAAYYRDHPAWAMTRAGDDSGRFAASELAVFACWALLGPLAQDLLEPLVLRGPDNGTLDKASSAARWAAVADRYADLHLTTGEITSALEAMTPGHGWSGLDADGQVAAKQRLLAALAPAIGPDTIRRWRTGAMRELAARYVAKSKRGPAESRAVLVKGVQPALAAWFGGDWLALLAYLGQQPAEGEVIQTALPAARLYVEGSAKVQQVAQEKNLPVADVSAMLASYLGSDAVQSPVQRRAAVIRSWWDALDQAQAVQTPRMAVLDPFLDPQLPVAGTPEDPFPENATVAPWLPKQIRADIGELWATALVPSKPDRRVSTVSPMHAMRGAIGEALAFWAEIGQSCWYICEGPYSRTELSGIRSYYRKYTRPMAEAGMAVDEGLFTELEAAEAQLGPPEPLLDPGDPIDAGHGGQISFTVGSGTRRAGYEMLRDIVTRYRRAWASAYLDTACRAAWEVPLREFADKINRALAARGKLPTVRQLATMAAPAANAWFGGDLSATLAAVGEAPVSAQVDARLLPVDRQAYCRRVWHELGGQKATIDDHEQYWTAHALLWLAHGAPKLIMEMEIRGQAPTAKEAGYADRSSWPDGLNFDRYLAAAIAALDEPAPTTPAPTQEPARPTNAATPAAAPAAAAPPIQNTTPAVAEGITPAATHSAAAATQLTPQRPIVAVPRPQPAAPAGWHPDQRQPGVLRWWDGRAWTAFLAPGPGASPGWFTDPQRSELVRWYDGRGWTEHVRPAQASPGVVAHAAAPVDDRPPWEVPGLPAGLTDTDFAAARQIAATLTGTLQVGQHVLEPVRGPRATYQHTYGAERVHNQARLRSLTARAPLARTPEGWSVYPAVLVADPSPSDTETLPVGASSEVGYVGSVWSRVSTAWAHRLRTALPEQRYFVTRVAVAEERWGLAAKVWLPALELPPWRR